MATRGVNKVILVGNVGNDPESRSFPDGSSVTNISIATSESWKDKQTGQQQERTEWHRVVLRDRGNFRLGQIAAQYLKKGSKVYIEGSLKTRSYEKDGQKLYVTEIIADEMQMLDGRGEAGGAGNFAPQQNTNNSYQQPKAAPVQQSQPVNQGYQQQPSPPASAGFDDFDDDIPF